MPPKRRDPIPLCLSCSSTILVRSKPGVDPKNSTYHTPCCSSPICTRCLDNNPRLKEWSPCLWCASGVNSLGSGSQSRAMRSAKEVEAEQTANDQNFEIGSDSEDDEREEDDLEGKLVGNQDPPPPYIADEQDAPVGENQLRAELDAGSEEEQETVDPEDPNAAPPRTHIVRKGETVRSLSLKYNLDPYDLITLNKLPHSAMSMSPNLLQTRKTITLSNPRPVAGQQVVDGVEDEHRTAERRVKRFQVMTKTPDQGIAKAYLAVQNIDDSVSLSSPGDVLFDAYEDGTQADSADKTSAEKSKIRANVSVEGRAVDRYYSDEEWAERMARETREEEERRSKRSGFGLKGLLGGKQDKGKGSNVKKGNYIQGAPWIESR